MELFPKEKLLKNQVVTMGKVKKPQRVPERQSLEKQVITMGIGRGKERNSENKLKKFFAATLLTAALLTPGKVQESPTLQPKTTRQVTLKQKTENIEKKQLQINHPQLLASIETSNELKTRLPTSLKITKLQNTQQKINEIILKRNFLRYRNLVRKMAHEYNIPPLLVHAIIQTESSYNPRAVSNASAFGLMGLQTQTIKDMINKGLIKPLPIEEYKFNPVLNMKAGLEYINWLEKNLYKDTPQTAEKFKKEREFFDRQPRWWRLKQVLKAYNVGINNFYKENYNPSENTYYLRTIKNMKEINEVVKKLKTQKTFIKTAEK